MSGSPKEKLGVVTEEEVGDARELYLSDGRKVVVRDQLVEIRNEAGMVEVRIQMTEAGPVLQMEAVKLQLKASEAVEIESKRVEIKTDEDIEVEAKGVIRINGKMIYLN